MTLRRYLTGSLLLVMLLSAAAAGATEVDFLRDVRPILEERCYQCHGAERQKSGLRLDVKEAAFSGGSGHAPDIIPGNAEASPLFRFISGADPDVRMPPEGDPLSPAQIDILKRWLDEGAVWPDGVDLAKLEDLSDHWSFKPVDRPEPPAGQRSGWARNDIDRFILHRLEEAGLEPNPEADRATWLRRVTLDLTGLPPTQQALDAFLADESVDAFEKVVDALLASPRYGERWAQHWLDVVRYADTHGFEVNTERPNAWPYRDYVIEAFNRDTPYDQFVREQIAGDVTGENRATGFLVTPAVLLPGQIGKDDASKRLARQDELTEIVTNTGEAFLGLSIGCARCHDHKFDAISARDFYALQAFFSGVQFGERPDHDPAREAERRSLRKRIEVLSKQLAEHVPQASSGVPRPAVNAAQNVERFPPVRVRRVRMVIESTISDNKHEPFIDELEVYDPAGRNLALAELGATPRASGSVGQSLSLLNDGIYGNESSWRAKEKGKGWVEIELPREMEIDRVVWGRDRTGKYKDRLALGYRLEVTNEAGTRTVVADSADRVLWEDKAPAQPLTQAPEAEALQAQLEPLVRRLNEELAAPTIYAGRFTEPEPIHLLRRGDPEQPGEAVPPAVLSALGEITLPATTTGEKRRMALADWIASPEHPLTARVMVNRMWQWHFSMGLVETANDFGRAGTPPSHPELLDWLAAEFTTSGWSMKHLHRLIVLSATYRQSAQIRPEAAAIDGDARLLWRYPSRRLEAEAIRDSILFVSGRLNLKAGGKGFDLFNKRGGLSGFSPVDTFGEDGRRRMIYAHKVRMERGAVFGAFDCPDGGQSMPRRLQSTTPIQALNLFNSRFTLDEAEALAALLETEAGWDAAEMAGRAWKLAYSREATPDELSDATAIATEHGWPTLFRAIFNSSEFLVIP